MKIGFYFHKSEKKKITELILPINWYIVNNVSLYYDVTKKAFNINKAIVFTIVWAINGKLKIIFIKFALMI